MYVCLCKGVTDRAIRQAVRNGAGSMKDLRRELGCSGQCGKCARQALDLLREEKQGLMASVAV